MRKNLFTLLLAIVASVGTMFAESGTCGSNVTWDLTDGVLTISGSGAMTDYYIYQTNSPWYSQSSSIQSVIITDGVTNIGSYAFRDCASLISVTIPGSVTTINNNAFDGCTSLMSFEIPNSVTNIRSDAFNRVNNVVYNGTASGSPWGAKCVNGYVDGWLVYNGYTKTILLGCSSAATGDISIPNSVSSIESYAFYKCEGLASVAIPNSVESIGNGAFYNCTGLTSIEIPNSVTSIGEYAFYGCNGLAYATIGNGVTSIGYMAFEGCSGLTSVSIPSSVTNIGQFAFSGVCNIVYNGTATGSPWGAKYVNRYVEGWLVYSDNTKTTLVGCSSAATGDISIPNSVTSIGESAFWNCTALVSVSIPNSVTSIGRYAFSNCSGLTSIEIPNSVTSIERRTFYNCSKLTSVTIGNSVESIDDEAFLGCSNLEDIHIADITTWCNITGLRGLMERTSKYKHLYLNDSEIFELIIPDNVTSIGSYAFYQCSELTSVTIGNSVESVESNAFSYCTGLTSITIPGNVTNIGGAFRRCTSLTSVTIREGVESIGDYAFRYCNSLTSVTIPNSVTSIGEYSFQMCSNLSVVTNYAITPQSIGYRAFDGVDKTSCTLYVPAESINLYQSSFSWTGYFSNIVKIPIFWNVKFLDYDNSVLSEQELEEGSAATPPANPSRVGYTFSGWDTDFSSVTEDLTVTAQYTINHYQVDFLDWNGTLLKSDNVEYGSAATPPANPSRDWYTFTGWDKDFSNITADLTVTAQYEEGQTLDNTIFFINGTNDSEISTQAIEIDFPTPPTIAGFTFLKWRVLAGDIKDGINIQAVYESNTPTSAPSVYTNPVNPAQKLIRDGSVYILTDDSRTYTITGQKVR